MDELKQFSLNTDQKGVFDLLSNEQAGKLIKDVFSYVCNEDIEQRDLVLEIALEAVKKDLDISFKAGDRKEANNYIRDKKIRDHVFERDGYECLSCYTKDNLSLDHIIPVSMGGPNTLDNLQTLCSRCNSKKGVSIIDFR